MARFLRCGIVRKVDKAETLKGKVMRNMGINALVSRAEELSSLLHSCARRQASLRRQHEKVTAEIMDAVRSGDIIRSRSAYHVLLNHDGAPDARTAREYRRLEERLSGKTGQLVAAELGCMKAIRRDSALRHGTEPRICYRIGRLDYDMLHVGDISDDSRRDNIVTLPISSFITFSSASSDPKAWDLEKVVQTGDMFHNDGLFEPAPRGLGAYVIGRMPPRLFIGDRSVRMFLKRLQLENLFEVAEDALP